MPTIKTDNTVTQINVFTVEPEKQQTLIDHLIAAAEIAKLVPGWKSISIHKSLDGLSVVNYAQAEDAEAQARIFAELSAKGLIERGHAFGKPHPGLYKAVYIMDR